MNLYFSSSAQNIWLVFLGWFVRWEISDKTVVLYQNFIISEFIQSKWILLGVIYYQNSNTSVTKSIYKGCTYF